MAVTSAFLFDPRRSALVRPDKRREVGRFPAVLYSCTYMWKEQERSVSPSGFKITINYSRLHDYDT